MTKKVGNTLVPRNPVAKSLLMKRCGALAAKQSTQRSASREALQAELGDWREDPEDLRSAGSGSNTKGITTGESKVRKTTKLCSYKLWSHKLRSHKE